MRVLFYKAKSGNWWDKLAAFCTCGPYSHCELQFSNGMCFSSSPRDGGVRFKMIDIVPEHWEIIDISNDSELEMRQWCETQVGLKYDWFGAIGLVFPNLFHLTRRHWFCSEICIAALNGFQHVGFNIDLSPNEFYTALVCYKQEESCGFTKLW